MNAGRSSTFDVALLWSRIKLLEEKCCFEGQPYPTGMCPFPFRLQGQGFFPGGDGRWREDDELHIAKKTLHPKRGIVFIGNDFGTLKNYRRREGRSFENPPMWKRLKHRVREAGLPTELIFCTNAILGLRDANSALTKQSWRKMPGFARMCAEFLSYQMQLAQPRLVVILGPDARMAYDSLIQRQGEDVLYTRHPYGDFGLCGSEREKDILALRSAWRGVRK